MTEKRMDRRGAIKTIGAGVVGVALGAAAGFILRPTPTATPTTVTRTVTRTAERTVTVTAQPTPPKLEQLRIVTWGGPWKDGAEYLARKAKEGGVMELEIDLHAGPSGASLKKLQGAWDPGNPLWDMFWGTAAVGFQGAETQPKVFTEIDESGLPNVKAIPREFKGYIDDRLYWVGLYSYGCVWVYRTDLVKTPIRSFRDLLKPEFKGKIAVPYPTYLPGAFLVQAAIANGGDQYNIDPGFELVKEMAEKGQIRTVFKSDADVLRLLETGDAWIAFTLTGNGLSLFRKGVKVANVLRLEDTKIPIFLDVVAVVDGPRKDRAHKFLNWMFDPDIIGRYAAIVGYVPSHPKALVDTEVLQWSLSVDQIKKYGIVLDFRHAAKNVDNWVKKWDTEITPLL